MRPAHTHTNRLIYSAMCLFFLLIFPSTHSDPTLNAGGRIFILNSFSSSREHTKRIKKQQQQQQHYLLGYKACRFGKMKP